MGPGSGAAGRAMAGLGSIRKRVRAGALGAGAGRRVAPAAAAGSSACARVGLAAGAAGKSSEGASKLTSPVICSEGRPVSVARCNGIEPRLVL